jgi:DNA-binding response OmpR family regulator
MPEGRRILLVDDDIGLRAFLAFELENAGFCVVEASTSDEADTMLGLEADGIEGVILDLVLPDGDGRVLCRRMRERGLRIPVLMLTGMDAEADVVSALDLGADDYVNKPVDARELIARLRAQLRLHEKSDHSSYAIGPFSFRPGAKLLEDTRNGRRIRLTEKEAATLTALYRSVPLAVPRQALVDEVWGLETPPSSHTLETHIYRLRQKMEVDPGSPKMLLRDGNGYRLVPASQVEALPDGES